jgi:hypothetical protein
MATVHGLGGKLGRHCLLLHQKASYLGSVSVGDDDIESLLDEFQNIQRCGLDAGPLLLIGPLLAGQLDGVSSQGNHNSLAIIFHISPSPWSFTPFSTACYSS